MNANIFPILILLSLASPSKSQDKASSVDQLKWLEGTWHRTNSKAGQSGFESWNKVSSSEIKGRGVTMHGNDTVFVEKLLIVARDGALFYVADVPENQKPVYFRLTEIRQNGFTCENPEHDFPKKIAYSIQGNKLRATISGDGKQIDYYFEK